MEQINLYAFVSPFVEFAFMKRALAAAVILALGSAPLGVFMTLRRMTLVGDAMAHAILPGVAVAFLIAGLSVWAMSIGGLLAAVLVALLVAGLTRYTQMKEDAAFSLLYLLALAVGVTLVSLKGSNVNLLHLLFGNVLGIDNDSLWLVTGACVLSLFTLAVLYRRLVIEGFDPLFLRACCGQCARGSMANQIFFVLLMINLVASFQAMGTLMALGLMILPAIAARFWSSNIDRIMPIAVIAAMAAAYLGLLVSYYAGVPSGPAIVLVAGGFTFLSAMIGRVGSVYRYLRD